MSTPHEHYLIRGSVLHPTSLEHEASITRKYDGRGRWVTCNCQTCPVCGQLIQTHGDGALETHGSGVGLRDICKGSFFESLAASTPAQSPKDDLELIKLKDGVPPALAEGLAPLFLEPITPKKARLR